MQEGLKWNVGDGLKVRFWRVAWVPGIKALYKYEDIIIPNTEVNFVMASYVATEGECDVNRLVNYNKIIML